MDGFSLFFVLDRLCPGCVQWNQVNNPTKKALNQFKLQENWNKIVEICNILRPRFPASVTPAELMQGSMPKFQLMMSELMEYDANEV